MHEVCCCWCAQQHLNDSTHLLMSMYFRITITHNYSLTAVCANPYSHGIGCLLGSETAP